METKKNNTRKKSKISIENAIVAGFCLKLIVTATFFLFFQDSPALPVQQAFAQDQAEAPVDEKSEGKKDDETKPESNAKANGSMTKAELIEWERKLKSREERVKTREKALESLEKEIQERMGEIEKTRQQLAELVKRNEALVKEQKELQQGRIEHLVSAYKGMRPESAGQLVNNLEDDVAVAILSAMPGRSAGQILANVDPKKAARLTKAISERKTQAPAETASGN
jgi:flagellar motility protein MotE (MotC chaperone)